MHLFYTPDIQPDRRTYQLSEEESKHAIRVLRLRLGDSVSLVDGVGGLFQAEISDAHPKRTQLEILSYRSDYKKRSYRLHIAISPTKNIDRVEWFLEKATEIGVDEITPLLCDHSERKEVKLDRLNKIVVAASKQSLKAYVPQLNPMIPLDVLLDQVKNDQGLTKGIAHCETESDKRFISEGFVANGNYLLLIGPEGDFSPREIERCRAAGFIPISLGESRLRTETAAVFACAEVALLNRSC